MPNDLPFEMGRAKLTINRQKRPSRFNARRSKAAQSNAAGSARLDGEEPAAGRSNRSSGGDLGDCLIGGLDQITSLQARAEDW